MDCPKEAAAQHQQDVPVQTTELFSLKFTLKLIHPECNNSLRRAPPNIVDSAKDEIETESIDKSAIKAEKYCFLLKPSAVAYRHNMHRLKTFKEIHQRWI